MPTELSHNGRRFIWHGPFETKDMVKAAGFRWDGANKHWYTEDTNTAKKLKGYANERALSVIEAAANTVEISTATCVEELPANVRDPILESELYKMVLPTGEKLRPFQIAGIVAGVYYLRHLKGVYLGDEMGLGKSVQAMLMAVLQDPESTRRIIVICPKAVTVSWQREIQKWLKMASRIFPSKKGNNSERFVIVPWSQVGAFLKRLEGKGIIGSHLIIDESHYAKNGDAARTKAVYGSWKKKSGQWVHTQGIMDYVESKPICLTGTPMPNRYIEAQTALKATGAGFAQNRDDYGRKYCFNRNNFSPRGFDFTGSINGEELYREMRGSTLIRRLVSEVAGDIPPIRQQPVLLQPNTELKKLIAVEQAEYSLEDREALLANVKGGIPVDFDMMSIVRHEMGLLKVGPVIEHIVDAVANIPDSEGIVLFAHHKDVIEQLHAALGDAGISSAFAHGEHSAEQRQHLVDRFAAGDFKVFVASISACGTGLNGMQTRSSTCMFAEFPWTPGEISQAVGRLKRIGQTSSVLAQFLVIEGSLDAYIISTVLQKVITQHVALDAAQQ